MIRKNLSCVICILFLANLVHAQAVEVPMKPENWQFTEGSKPKFQNFAFKDSLFLGEVVDKEHNDIAYLDDVEMQDGILEMDFFDVWGDPGFVFRMQSEGDYEVVYVRPFDSGGKKFLQYAPVYNSELSWQLYTHQQGAGVINRGGWTHVKAVFIGPRLEVFIDHRDTPSLVVENLRRGISTGKVGIFGLLPSYMANFKYTILDPQKSYPEPTITIGHNSGLTNWPNSLPGDKRSNHHLIKSWEISDTYQEDEINTEKYPGEKQIQSMKWSKVTTDYDGMLPIDKYRKKKIAGAWQDNSHDMVWLKKVIHSDKDKTSRFEFDFSNKVIVYLNGKPLYAGNHTWYSKQGYLWGSIAWGGSGVYLPLKQGENELLIALISESDGWGILGRINDIANLKFD